MRKICLTGISALLFLFPSLAAASDNLNQWYAGANVSQIDYDESGFDSFNPITLNAVVGRNITPYYGFEARAGFGVNDDSVSDVFEGYNISLDLSVDYILGVYARGNLPVNERFSVYGLLGVSQAKITAKASVSGTGQSASGSFSESETDISYGVGASFSVNERVSLQLEYLNVVSPSEFDISALSLGFSYRF
ncbi:porin family protein [Aliidiomarina minuta]|nr:porin family protein [Aliidiomarina minuta]